MWHLLDFWHHNYNLLFVPQDLKKFHRSSLLRFFARDIEKNLFYSVLGNVTQKKKLPYGDLCNITIPFGRPDWSMGVQYLPWVINEHCLEFTQFLSRNIDVRVVPDLRMQEM